MFGLLRVLERGVVASKPRSVIESESGDTSFYIATALRYSLLTSASYRGRDTRHLCFIKDFFDLYSCEHVSHVYIFGGTGGFSCVF